MRYFILIVLLLLLGGCNVFRPSWIDENYFQVEEATNEDEDSILPNDMGPLGGHFDENGEWIPDDPDIALTYKIPDISAGFIFDLNGYKVTPSIQVELFEIDTHIPYVRRFKFDAGVGYQRAYLYVGKLWTSIFEISTGGFVGWNFEDRELSYGVGATIIRF